MTQITRHVCAISGRKVKTVLGYIAVNFEVASSSSFRDIKKNNFVTVAADIFNCLQLMNIFIWMSSHDFISRLHENLSTGWGVCDVC